MAVALILLAAQRPARADKWALLIGIDSYKNTSQIDNLGSAAADARALKSALIESDGFPAANIRLLVSDADPQALESEGKPERNTILRELASLARKVQPGDTVFVAFSGHGVQVGGDAYLMPYDADAFDGNTLADTSIKISLFRERLAGVRAGLLFLAFDMCRNTPFRGSRGLGDTGNALKASQVRGLDFSDIAGKPTTSAPSAPRAVVTMFSCSENERSYEWIAKARGYFSFYLEQALRGAKAAVDADGAVHVSSLTRYVSDNVAAAVKRDEGKTQTPLIEITGEIQASRIALTAAKAAVASTDVAANMGAAPDTRAYLNVGLSPPNARIFIDGAEQRMSGGRISVNLNGEADRFIEVGFEASGYKTRVERVKVQRGTIEPLAISLDKLDAPAPSVAVAGSSTAVTAPTLEGTATSLGAKIYREGDGPLPAIHGPRIVGATPGRPFLFRIPATGDGPLVFSAARLPAGLHLDSSSGVLSGSLRSSGRTVVDIAAVGRGGAASAARRSLVIVGGSHQLALTPPMGWNSWIVWGPDITAEKVKAAADSFERDGLAAHGYSYVNIDDGWQGDRQADGTISCSRGFGSVLDLAGYVHTKGLKLGLVSSPGRTTCAGRAGSYGFELQDAVTYCDWGVDYLKYVWCSYGEVVNGDRSIPTLKKPFTVMRNALDQVDRDIVYNLCKDSVGDPWSWAADDPIHSNSWRTSRDIHDSWSDISGIGFQQDRFAQYAGPGHWNDPDMLAVGVTGAGNLHPTNLSEDEQVTHVSLWCLQSAPLLIGCDLTKIDAFTRALLTNDEILDIDQDPLGQSARRKSAADGTEVWAKPLFDGTLAVGLFNRGDQPARVSALWSDLGLTGRQPVRDLWRRKDLEAASDVFAADVPAHGAVVVKIGKPIRTDLTE